MGGFKLTGMATGTAATDSARLGDVQNSKGTKLGTVAGTNTITAQATPTLTAYADGQTFRFIAAGANTGATTLNIDSLGAKNVFWNGSACSGGEIGANSLVQVTYDGTQFNLQTSAALGSNPFSDATAIVKNSADATKLVKLSAASVTTGTTRTVTVPDKNGTMAMTSDLSGQLLGIVNFTAQTQALTSISNATPAVFTCTSAAHLPETGSPVQFTTSGTLPTGLSLNTTYYVTNPSGTTYNVCTTYADALAGTNKVATSGAGSGTHTMNSVYPKTGIFGTPSSVLVEVWGAGGGGGGVTAVTQNTGGGGAAGGYSRRKIAVSSLASNETVTIGAGGTAGANTGGDGGTGGTSSFGTWATATGGGPGKGNTTAISVAGGNGGAGASGDLNLTGNPGGAGTADSGGGNTSVHSGWGGASTLGGAGKAVTTTTAAGNSGVNNSGSGASGGYGATAQIGGVGGSGRVIVWEYS